MERMDSVNCLRGRLVAPILFAVAVGLAGCATPSPQTALNWPVGVTYTVRAGDTLSEIARSYGISERALARDNSIANGNRIFAGQVLRVSHATAVASAEPDRRPRRRWKNAVRPVGRAAVSEARLQAPRRSEMRRTGAADEAQPQPVEQAQIYARSLRFVWPVAGRVIAPFGVDGNGERNDGINIAATLGEPIHAAAAGTVTYVGDALKGYGNLVLIRHEDGYVTAYAHAQSVAVKRDDRVAKGQVIAYAGATGDVSRPQLHFEIRQGVRPIDPKPLLVASN